MLKTPMPTQHELEMVTLEELVPKDHLLRQIDAAAASFRNPMICCSVKRFFMFVFFSENELY
ncbi:hypothetical protein [Burkholderia mallei]|uniref:hypothetical protein n=1 Tax=Burkholderia mallei TaxID=13373 RepID=UPI000A36A708|nr:hypothetical protein [Burkholderia mallei]